jgi:hypothetical protein
MVVWFWLCMASICGGAGAIVACLRSGPPAAGFLVGFLFGPLGLFLVALTGGDPCPECRGPRHSKATRCCHCGISLDAEEREAEKLAVRLARAKRLAAEERAAGEPAPASPAAVSGSWVVTGDLDGRPARRRVSAATMEDAGRLAAKAGMTVVAVTPVA